MNGRVVLRAGIALWTVVVYVAYWLTYLPSR